ncbi:Krueppel-like factor 10 [Chelonus insularis]|uniref:Krueppel-like factor 10 n=1 Tax=Chelonus insularis TaxID=460826 RepID=UPI001589DC86|nr:Krueppel-like factor 10 [Chelonus insularis]
MTMEDRSGPSIDRADGAASAHSCTTQVKTATADGIPSDASYPLHRNGSSANKRSFDVAFLVAPDEKLAKRQSTTLIDQGIENRQSPGYNIPVSLADLRHPVISISDRTSPSSLSASPPAPAFQGLHHPSHLSEHPRHHINHHHEDTPLGQIPKSAFTKVSSISFDENQGSTPRSSISPDRPNYRNSVSPPNGPPIKTALRYGTFAAAAAAAAAAVSTPFPFLVNSGSPGEPAVQPSITTTAPGLAENLKIGRKINNAAESTGFRASNDLSPAAAAAVYSNLSYSPISVFPAPMTEALVRPRHFLGVTGVTGVAGLLPPSFALSLPAQNICAKCNLSFRMTSDLVYHMRSHHKNENSSEAARRRREEKLRCPVCDESFRERHHLTRHMTAHQDKESDVVVDQQQQQQIPLPTMKRTSGGPTVVHGTAK